MNEQPEKVVIVGNPTNGDTELLRVVFSRLISSEENIMTIMPDRFDVEGLMEHAPNLCLFIFDGMERPVSPDGMLKNYAPSSIVSDIWNLIEANVLFPVHVAVSTERFGDVEERFTALDTLAIALSGVSGVWEISSRLLSGDSDIPSIQSLGSLWKYNRVLLYGRPATQLDDFYIKITAYNWPATGEDAIEPLYIKYSFQTALALASLEVEDMSLEKNTGIKLEHFAEKLLSYQDRTGLSMSKSVLSRTLGHLNRGWAERIRGYDKKRKFEMPMWARQEGFPQNLPLIRGYEPLRTTEKLYRELELIEFARDWKPGDRVYTSISIGRS